MSLFALQCCDAQCDPGSYVMCKHHSCLSLIGGCCQNDAEQHERARAKSTFPGSKPHDAPSCLSWDCSLASCEAMYRMRVSCQSAFEWTRRAP
eukprot:313293-Amphidinium_carterae.1